MGVEIERKFLVKDLTAVLKEEGIPCKQGYLSVDLDRSVRVRVAGGLAYLTVKGASRGMSRTEFEYEIPLADAERMLADTCIQPILLKTRYTLGEWEVDVFHGENEGLVIAEFELSSDCQVIEIPDWVGEDVTDDKNYYNAVICTNPYSRRS